MHGSGKKERSPLYMEVPARLPSLVGILTPVIYTLVLPTKIVLKSLVQTLLLTSGAREASRRESTPRQRPPQSRRRLHFLRRVIPPPHMIPRA